MHPPSVGFLGFLHEILAQHLVGFLSHQAHLSVGPLEHLMASKANAKAFKMASFGFLVSAPLGHGLCQTHWTLCEVRDAHHKLACPCSHSDCCILGKQCRL